MRNYGQMVGRARLTGKSPDRECDGPGYHAGRFETRSTRTGGSPFNADRWDDSESLS